jgi:lipopolysaccharide transport system permease protein
MWLMIQALWAYRNFIYRSVCNDFKNRFARSKLGGFWMILHPLAQVAMFALILSNVLAAKLPGVNTSFGYALYLMAGTLGWSLFSELVGRSLNLFIENGNLIKKVRFPRIALPAILAGSCLINNALLLISVMVIFWLMGEAPNIQLLWLPFLIFITLALALGLGLCLSIINVFIRDVGQIVPILLQLLYWFTPIVYPASIIPEKYRGYLELNPIFPLITSFQNILVYKSPPLIPDCLIVFLVAIIFLFIGLVLFRRANSELVDIL